MSFPFGGGFPFGGMGGHADHMGASQNVDNTKLYEILGVDKKADQKAITKAFRILAMKHHPDKGGDPEKFRQISEANEILSNPEKRELYDQYGMEGVKSGGGGGQHFGDIFSMFGMQGGRQGGGKQVKKGKAVLKKLEVKLEDVYSGKLFKLKHDRQQLCQGCDGKGGANQKKCAGCKGQGVVVKMQMIGPGMYQQSQQACQDCRGQGVTVDEKDICTKCKGKKVFQASSTMEISVEQGCPHEHDYIQSGMGDEAPGIMGGDVHVRVYVQKHATFERKGADLFMEKKISLIEALSGTNFEIKHLDGKNLKVSTLPQEVLSHNETKCVKGKGMPFFKDSLSYGNLYIKFLVQFPKRGEITESQADELSKILPGPKVQKIEKGEKFEYLDDYYEQDLNPNEEGGQKKDQDEEEEQGQRQNVQCAQQ